MKRSLITFFAAIISTTTLWTQSPDKLSYQAIIRNSSNALVTNTQIGMQLSILQGSATGTAVYTETQSPTANVNGLVSIEIGAGTVISGSFTNIDWSNGPYFIKTETDPSGGTNYTITGTSQLLSVPYALHAKTAETVTGNISETDPAFTSWDKSTGISITQSQISDLDNYIVTETDPLFTAWDKNYNDLINKPTVFDSNYNHLTNKPELFSGSFADLTNKPTTLSGYGITNAVSTNGDETISGNKTFNGTVTVPAPLNATDAATKAYVDTSAVNKALEQCIQDIFSRSGGGTVLWLGTSIPEGSEYPAVACNALGYKCINNARGGSFMTFDSIAPDPGNIVSSSGFSLSATIAEMEEKWRPVVTGGHITEEQLTTWKTYSYENLLLPYLNDVDIVVIDHGFNDKSNLASVVSAGEEAINWSSRDKSTFIGAYGYLIDEILRRKPFIKIVVWGYFQNKINLDGYNGSSICKVQEWIARHYNFPLADVWNYSGISDLYIKDTQNYIADFNTKYGKDYVKWHPDSNGNIMSFQIFCPDAVHPHTDLTGNSDKRLNAIAIKLLRDVKQ